MVLIDWWKFTLTGEGQMAPFKIDPKYASPEELIKRIRGLKCGSDFSADIFAIGMTLTELLLGVKIWKNMSDVDIMRVSLRKAELV